MKKSILNLGTTLNKKQQQSINGGSNCRACYANNGGAYNSSDRNCWGCPLPEMV
ncbi:hypothetical protein [Tenacibaculum sp. M341]|uniref:hypothetical protein n=1 Tax=Tenacibaculum sp. M341 TaxID=2530339 RepID=UPI0014054757|nr:hypothetical protein [Tenacibaculum sp. M341]